jgi:NarL family two-component system sensor histidine kinase LiaS
LRGKLILTYTLVTVLALLALEVLVLLLLYVPTSLLDTNQHQYFSDVVSVLYPQASSFLQPGSEDLPGLQSWLEGVYNSGYASLPPQNIFDSPAAPIDRNDPMYVLSAGGTVLAQAPHGNNSLIGRQYTPPDISGSQRILENALKKDYTTQDLYIPKPDGNYLIAVPISAKEPNSQLVGVIVLAIKPAPVILGARLAQASQNLLVVAGVVLLTGTLLLMAVAPFGALFGLIMSRGLTRRLKALTQAADAWSEGDFSVLPQDRSQDEIGILGRQMRHMAERIHALLHTQQELAMMEERNRLARDLHDTVKQQTFATLMQVRAARNLLAGSRLTDSGLADSEQSAEALKHLEEAEGLIKTSQQELGRVIEELRPAALEGQGLAVALQDYVNRWSQRSCIPATFQAQNEQRLPLEVEQTLYRVAGEALSNIVRHSRASAAAVFLDYQPDQVSLVVSDNGIGFDPQAERSGFGLQAMQERLARLSGNLVIDSSPENGSVLTATLPIPDLL